MRRDLGWVRTDEEVLAFGKKVESLRTEGMSYADIARRFNIGRTTMESRVKAYRKLLKATSTH